MTARKKPERILFRVAKGALVPADELALMRLRARGYNLGDQVTVEIRKARNPKFHRMAHALGHLLAENVDAFTGMSAHAVLKRLQLESGAGCESVAIYVPGVGMCEHRQALSLSFENMDEGEFQEIYAGLCDHVVKRYWPDLDAGQVEEMASLVGMAA
jgi:hypothetical protein